ncbi:hypothetical protein [Rhodoplanes sp. Z2-YC6860]|uniref:hypothetical protein n=1 Tax=Rhodoplanes sp. Z2-YC6860 TaxID=674703 RepID=UPI000835E383|nr:hypothetical protein [Rhodoplanes sp. Z2-YC6860]
MLISNRAKTFRAKTLAAAAFTASFIALSSTAPVYAQSGYTPARHHDRTATHNRGREAFGMAVESSGGGFADRNSPQATGGGSVGYNRKLLEY